MNDDGGENTGAELSENREIVLFVCCPTKIKNKKDKYIRVCRLKNGHLYRSSAVSNGAH